MSSELLEDLTTNAEISSLFNGGLSHLRCKHIWNMDAR